MQVRRSRKQFHHPLFLTGLEPSVQPSQFVKPVPFVPPLGSIRQDMLLAPPVEFLVAEVLRHRFVQSHRIPSSYLLGRSKYSHHFTFVAVAGDALDPIGAFGIIAYVR